MSVFVDTSALYGLLVRTEKDHRSLARAFETLAAEGTELVTSNYVLVETTALLQSRFGLEAVRDLQRRLIPVLRVLWVGEEQHRRAADRLVREDRRGLSLVDWTSFVLMEAEGVRTALALDPDFEERGFRLVPLDE